ncbi:MAG: ATP-binding protein [Clostridia bacterium]|nr:ATP-binding protein [Clostridia bacterium]
MVTISQIRTKHFFLAGIRWKILLAFFLIVGISFGVAATSLTGVVSEYMYKQRIREDGLAIEKLATTLSPLFQYARVEELNEAMNASAGELGGRLLLLDRGGKVQADTFARMNGERLELPEVVSILTEGGSADYGIHRIGNENARDMSGENGTDMVAYCTARIVGTRGTLGVLLYVGRISEMLESIRNVELQLLRVFVVVAAGALILALILSQILTKPITALSRTMRKMGKGDLSVRVPVKGSGELRELAENYNTMAAQLESLDKTRNQFVSNASHELKTPLTTMKILLENLIYQPEMPQELRTEFMQDINHEIDRLTGIITDLLTLTKMDNHSANMKRERINMTELTQETVHLLTPMAETHGQQITTDIANGLVLNGDRTKLAQILYNLIDNAIKYTPDNGMVSVSLAQNGNSLIWRVKDNGIGIPAEDQAHIFERFYRVDKARSRETGGTGLGLSIVRQLVHLHDGTISVESEPGKGTEFTVTLPVREE